MAGRLEKGEEEVRRLGGVLNAWLSGRPFLCGDNPSLADFSVGAWLNYAERAKYPIDDFREIRRWSAGLMEFPHGASRSWHLRSRGPAAGGVRTVLATEHKPAWDKARRGV